MNIEELAYYFAAAVMAGFTWVLLRFLISVPLSLRRIAKLLEIIIKKGGKP